ncbi:MAG: hypothetical protein R2702_09130 [Acidimicrobiales bacterium]
MHRLRPLPVAAFSALTLLIWVNRIWLAWTNADDTVAQKVVWSIPIVAFVVAAAVLLVAQLRGRSDAPWFRPVVLAFAAATTLYWAIRLPIIWVNDHGLTADEELGFKLVHTVLAVASVGAAAFAARWARPGSERPGPKRRGSAVA